MNTFLNVLKVVMTDMSRLKETYTEVKAFTRTHDADFQPVNLGAFYHENGTQFHLLFGIFGYQARFVDDPKQPRISKWIKNPVLAVKKVDTRQGVKSSAEIRTVAYEADLKEFPRPLVRSLKRHLAKIDRAEKKSG